MSTFTCHYCEGQIPLAGNRPGGRATCPHCGVQADVPYAPPGAEAGPPRRAPQATQMFGAAQAANDAGNMALIFGVLGLFVCAIMGPIAIMKGNESKALAYDAGVPTPGTAVAGLVCGWITTILLIAGLGMFCLFFGLAILGGSM